MVLTIVIAESALQLVPRQIQSHSQIKQYAQKRGKRPNEVLLDRAFHHAAMLKLAHRRNGAQIERMGRPDIVHTTLLQILETPLNWEGQLQVIVHTQEERVITVNPKVRLPKNYVRFVGLMEQLLTQHRVPIDGEALMQVEKTDLAETIRNLESDKLVGLSILGEPILLHNLTDQIAKFEKPVVFIGGFPRGHFSEETRRLMDEICCVDRKTLDAWVAAGRFVYDFEWGIGVAQGRIERKN
ncbi:MAG TPA: hypothetical protein VLV18_05210 [Terriglobales bacterium]|nr:hypothetical protein [Terriglobales bacterium]